MTRVRDMTDSEVLEAAGSFGPGIIGRELYARAERIRKVNPQGMFGPGIIGDTNKPEPPEMPAGKPYPAATVPEPVPDPVPVPAKFAEKRAPGQDAATEAAFLAGTLPEKDRREGDERPLPRVSDLDAVLDTMDADEVKALRARDTRKSAREKYRERLRELKG